MLRKLLMLLGLVAILAGGGLVYLRASADGPKHVNATGGVGLDGYDPVAYFTLGRPAKGLAEHSASHDGATWRFASAAHKALFVADPDRYLPRYGGFCAFGVANGYKVDIDPEAWRIVDGRLYLNYDKSVQRDWEKDIPARISRADANWPTLATR